jgi:hypothetical protein
MPSPCPCRGCTAAYKRGLDVARDTVLNQFTDAQTDEQGARVIREHQVLDAIAEIKGS